MSADTLTEALEWLAGDVEAMIGTATQPPNAWGQMSVARSTALAWERRGWATIERSMGQAMIACPVAITSAGREALARHEAGDRRG